jgi:hypothetical protein
MGVSTLADGKYVTRWLSQMFALSPISFAIPSPKMRPASPFKGAASPGSMLSTAVLLPERPEPFLSCLETFPLRQKTSQLRVLIPENGSPNGHKRKSPDVEEMRFPTHQKRTTVRPWPMLSIEDETEAESHTTKSKINRFDRPVRIVVNDVEGEFGLSERACTQLKEMGVDESFFHSPTATRRLPRTDQRLVQVVETLGQRANGPQARLCIKQLAPWQMKMYEIENENGKETIVIRL